MASNLVGGRQLQDLECPVCYETFSEATNLDCGHTFCRDCLESYVKKNDNTDRIKCPVCRVDTELGIRSVKGLKPNFSVRGLVDAIHNEEKNSSSRRICPRHKQVYLDIFCDDCKDFICHKCYGTDHQGHTTHKYEELEVEWTKKRQELVQKIDRRKIQFEEFENEADQDRMNIHCHLSSLEKEIKDVFAKKVTVLQEIEEDLLKEVDEIRKDSDKVIDDCVNKHRLQLEEISRSLTARDGDLDADTLKAFHLQYNDLNNSFEERIEDEAIIRVKQRAKSSKFSPDAYQNTLLALGSIEVGVTEKLGEHHESGSIHDSATIVRNVRLPKSTWGMAATTCGDAVVVGYGDQIEGSDWFSSSGERKPYVTNGAVWDIAIQANGRSVVSHGKNTCNVYEETIQKCFPYRLVTNTCIHYDILKVGGWYMMLCCDQQDNTYAVNYNREIYIFSGNDPEPRSVVPTDTKASQICVTKKSGVMITSTCDTTPSTITVLDREGNVGSTPKATDDNEYLFAAVDTQDRVLVARVRGESDVLKLRRYELNGTELKLETRFTDLKLPHAIRSIEPSQSFWCYMVSLTPNRVAFANHRHLYFVDIPDGGFGIYSRVRNYVGIRQ